MYAFQSVRFKILTLFLFSLFILACKNPGSSSNTNKGSNSNINDFGILGDPVNVTGNQVSFEATDMSFDDFVTKAKSSGKPYWVYFYADWCKPCKRLSAYTFSDPGIIDFSDTQLLAYKVDVDQFVGMDIAERFSVGEYPTILLFDEEGQLKDKIEGFLTANVFLNKLKGLKKS